LIEKFWRSSSGDGEKFQRAGPVGNPLIKQKRMETEKECEYEAEGGQWEISTQGTFDSRN